MFGLGVPELLLIMGIVVLVFGAGKLATVGSALGKSVREFRSATEEPVATQRVEETPATVTTAAPVTVSSNDGVR